MLRGLVPHFLLRVVRSFFCLAKMGMCACSVDVRFLFAHFDIFFSSVGSLYSIYPHGSLYCRKLLRYTAYCGVINPAGFCACFPIISRYSLAQRSSFYSFCSFFFLFQILHRSLCSGGPIASGYKQSEHRRISTSPSFFLPFLLLIFYHL